MYVGRGLKCGGQRTRPRSSLLWYQAQPLGRVMMQALVYGFTSKEAPVPTAEAPLSCCVAVSSHLKYSILGSGGRLLRPRKLTKPTLRKLQDSLSSSPRLCGGSSSSGGSAHRFYRELQGRSLVSCLPCWKEPISDSAPSESPTLVGGTTQKSLAHQARLYGILWSVLCVP